MSYWQYRKEKTVEGWHNFIDEQKEWWSKNGLLFFAFGPMLPAYVGYILLFYSFQFGISLVIVSGIWFLCFLTIVGVTSERENFKKWKKRHITSLQQKVGEETK